jgi:hypothetical protein
MPKEKDKPGIPPNLGKSETTMLVVKMPKMNKENTKLQSVFEEYYKGKYKMIEAGALDKPEYADTEKFGFVFNYKSRFQEATGFGSTRDPAHWVYTAEVIDRATNQTYALDYEGDAYGPFFKSYVKKLEAARAKNAGN